MLELLELLISSPLGAAALNALQNVLYAAIVLMECEDCGFNDLGVLLFGGVLAAIAVGVLCSLLWRRARDSKPHRAEVNSIRPRDLDR